MTVSRRLRLHLPRRSDHVSRSPATRGQRLPPPLLPPDLPMDRYREEKINQCEEFLERRLKPALVRAITDRDKVFEQQQIFSDLKRSIQILEKNSVTRLSTLVNLGSEVYAQADVPDTRHIFVDIGLGFHVEFTWSETLIYIEAKEERLAKQIEEYTNLIARIKADSKMVSATIRELLEIPAE